MNLSRYADIAQPKILSCPTTCFFPQLLGWDLKSLWHTANQQQCYALFRAGSFRAAVESYQFIMDKTDDDMKAGFRAGFAGKPFGNVSPSLFTLINCTSLSSQVKLTRALHFPRRWCACSQRLLVYMNHRDPEYFHLCLDSSRIAQIALGACAMI
jgi:hypothetical protein